MIRTMRRADEPQGHDASASPAPGKVAPPSEVCDHCGSTDVEWVKCKMICRNCRQINKSCADL